ncbi:hypothetical protein J2Y58_004184 [Sphingomonas sp. BE138]|uniref:hypothetical protein n=1 Tax=Sphingomonas sp. BE138 TaxID=2817845 RepID=UPI0028625AD3|nr:hypothetical protein [Sphingomonas sp. BE138]MDR6790801.1 hypothetical protein [Sphingomonas sp. BE138]
MSKKHTIPRMLRSLQGYEKEMPAAWPTSSHWEDAVEQIAKIMSRERFERCEYVMMLNLGAFAVRQYNAERAAEGRRAEGEKRPYVWIYDSPSEGWDVEVPGGDSHVIDRWFAIRSDARLYAEGLSAATGWVIEDDSTDRDEAAEYAADQAATLADELLRQLRGKAGEA